MTKRTLLYPFYFLFLFFASHLAANCDEENEKAFYALSSLRFHIDEQLLSKDLAAGKHEVIHFEESDLAALWQRAAKPAYSAQVAEAEKYFWEAKNPLCEQSLEMLLKSKQLVEEVWTELNPLCHDVTPKGLLDHRYLLPADHWLQSALDEIFAGNEALKDHHNFKKAGFDIICKRSSKMIVASHEKIEGYLIKAYLQSDKPNLSWKWMCNRCEGAENIRKLIKKKKLKHFIVPDKWIYRLPEEVVSKGHRESLNKQTDPAVLVVTRMNIGSYEHARLAWKEKVTHEVLRELYCILSHGFASLYLVLNIPYTHDGKFACLDTEFPFRHFNYEKVYHYLSDEMKLYWEILIKTGGHP